MDNHNFYFFITFFFSFCRRKMFFIDEIRIIFSPRFFSCNSKMMLIDHYMRFSRNYDCHFLVQCNQRKFSQREKKTQHEGFFLRRRIFVPMKMQKERKNTRSFEVFFSTQTTREGERFLPK